MQRPIPARPGVVRPPPIPLPQHFQHQHQLQQRQHQSQPFPRMINFVQKSVPKSSFGIPLQGSQQAVSKEEKQFRFGVDGPFLVSPSIPPFVHDLLWTEADWLILFRRFSGPTSSKPSLGSRLPSTPCRSTSLDSSSRSASPSSSASRRRREGKFASSNECSAAYPGSRGGEI